MIVHDFGRPVLTLWFACFQKLLNQLTFKYFGLECIWRQLFQKRVLYTKFDIYVWYLRLISTFDIYAWYLRLISTFDIYVWYLRLISMFDIYVLYSKNKTLNRLNTTLSCWRDIRWLSENAVFIYNTIVLWRKRLLISKVHFNDKYWYRNKWIKYIM